MIVRITQLDAFEVVKIVHGGVGIGGITFVRTCELGIARVNDDQILIQT